MVKYMVAGVISISSRFHSRDEKSRVADPDGFLTYEKKPDPDLVLTFKKKPSSDLREKAIYGSDPKKNPGPDPTF